MAVVTSKWARHALIGLLIALPAPALASQRDCTPYYEASSTSVTVFTNGSADLSTLASWPGVVVAASANQADVVWDPEKESAYDRSAHLISKNISDLCALSAVISQIRASSVLSRLAVRGGVDLFTAPAANGFAYDGEKIGIVASLRSNSDHRYVTIFDLTGDGSVSLLYPIESDGNGLVKPGHLVKVSDLVVTKPYGSDHFVAVVTDVPQTDFRDVLKYIIGRVRVQQGVYYTDLIATNRDTTQLVGQIISALKSLQARDPTFAIGMATLFTAARPHVASQRAEIRLAPNPPEDRTAPVWATDVALEFDPSVAFTHALPVSFSRTQLGLENRRLRAGDASSSELAEASAVPMSDLPPATNTKLALVIGNSDYKNANTLTNPANDANEIANELRQEGFRLVGDKAQIDLSIAAMQDILRTTYIEAKSARSLFVFYAGHGVQSGGRNYLIPVDAKLDAEADLDLEAIKLADVFSAAAPAGRTVVVVDACRTSGFPLKDSHGARRGFYAAGLSPEILPGGLVAYSTLPGHVAADGTGPHSPYTAALLLHLREPKKSAREILGEVYDDFSKSLGNAHLADENTQLPIFEDMMGSQQFYF